MRTLGLLVGSGMVVEAGLTLLSPRMVLASYQRWRWVIPRPLRGMYEQIGSLPDYTLRGVAFWELVTGILLVLLARRSRD